jgi:hypothetical protein
MNVLKSKHQHSAAALPPDDSPQECGAGGGTVVRALVSLRELGKHCRTAGPWIENPQEIAHWSTHNGLRETPDTSDSRWTEGREELIQQSALANAGFAFNEDAPALRIVRRIKLTAEELKFLPPSDKDAAPESRRHRRG